MLVGLLLLVSIPGATHSDGLPWYTSETNTKNLRFFNMIFILLFLLAASKSINGHQIGGIDANDRARMGISFVTGAKEVRIRTRSVL